MNVTELDILKEENKLLIHERDELKDQVKKGKVTMERINYKISNLTINYEYLDQKFDEVYSLLTEEQKKFVN